MSIQTAMKHFDDSLEEAVGNKAEAEKAVVHWTEIVRKLTEAKGALSLILSPEDLAAAPAKTAKPSAKKAAAKSGVAVPKTDAAFWNGLLTTEPQGTKDILELACKKLNVTDPEAIKTIQARQTAYLQTAAKDGLIKSEGERLQRKYFV